MHHIVFLDQDTFPQSIQFCPPSFAHQWQSFGASLPEQTISRLQNATIAITNKVMINEDILKHCPKLQYIAVAATGVNVVDLDACKRRNICVANVTGYATDSVAEHTFMLILALYKQLKGYNHAVASGQWQQSAQFCFFLDNNIRGLRGQTLGLIGTGAIALATAKLAQAFGMPVLFHSPSGRSTINDENTPCVALNTLLQNSDVVSVHCPLTPQTHQLINANSLQHCKPTGIIINTARGPVVDEEAVIRAIQTHQLAGAGLDVLTSEPPSQQSLVMQAVDDPRLIITPHTAWASHCAMQTLADQLIATMNRFVAGHKITNLAEPV